MTTNKTTTIAATNRALVVRDLLTGAVARRNTIDEMFLNENQEHVVIDNPDLFEVLETAPEEEPAGYTVQDGVLLKDGSPVTEQGKIRVKRILTKGPGKLLLLTGDGDDEIKLTTYSPSEDKFQGLISLQKNFSSFESEDGRFTILETSSTEREVDDETYEEFKSSRLILLTKDMNFVETKLHIPADTVVFTRNHVLAISARKVIYDDSLGFEKIIKDDTISIERIRDNKDLGIIQLKADDIESITESLDSNLLIKAGNVIYFSNDGHSRRIINDPKVEETEGFNDFVAISFADEGYTFTLTLANEKRETVKITSRGTRDRGPVVSVE
ncbi:hypothetical protein SAMN05216391_1199 [Lachnospiraceae bacterium KHCPX20]|nr:hypothetical protein SAMN05216391_1199 [Lachnospiraceae bacterium KHCPX20]